MAKLIDADELIHSICRKCNDVNYDDPCEPSDCAFYYAVHDAPTVDAVPVVHGRWIEDYDTFIQDNGYESEPIHTGFVCSVCGKHSFAIEPFCHCGAKMDLEVKDV